MPSTSSQRGNVRVQVLKDENENPNITSKSLIEPSSSNDREKSVVRSIIDAARDQENRKEPGPWNRANSHKKGKLFGSSKTSHELGFEIHEDGMDDDFETVKKPCIPPIPVADDELKFNKPFIYPEKFCAVSKPIKGWMIPVTTEEKPDTKTLSEYNKCKLYPRPNVEFQPEELKAYNVLKKRGINNEFTKERDVFWCSGPQYNVRFYPHFATKSKDQTPDSMDHFFMPEKIPGLKVAFEEIYKKEDQIERQFEEILASRIKRNETIMETADIEETMCLTSEVVQRRKSFFPMRKSMAPATFKTSSTVSVMPVHNENLEKPSPEVSVSNAEIGPAGVNAIQVTYENKNDILPESNKEETIQTSAPATLPSLALKVASNNEEPRQTLVLKELETEWQSQVDDKKTVGKAISPIPFQIFQDDSAVEEKCSPNVPDEAEFQFKTPAVPIASSATIAAVPRKLPFEIFEEENLHQNSVDIGCGTGGFFDAEETCSTQTFNIFLKAQSVSTPKATLKAKPQRQFGTVLKEVTPPESKSESVSIQCPPVAEQNCAAEIQNTTPAAPETVPYSPVRERLSTILETSEHGTTQGTHSTGATTKSTISSPEIDAESQVQTPATVGSHFRHTVLETVKEMSCEIPVDKVMENPKNQNTDNNISKVLSSSAKVIETPLAMRLQNKSLTGGLEKSLFDLSIKKAENQVGNFSRLEEREDTAASLMFKLMPSIRFQDDKTETIPQIFVSSQQFKFQDDKTETIPKIVLEAPSKSYQNQEERTDNISKIFLDPPKSVKYPDDKTETISKFMFEAPQLPIFDDKVEPLHVEEEKGLGKSVEPNDSFEFFGQSPPKASKQLLIKQVERCSLSQVRTASDSRTPLMFDSKRFCGKDARVHTKPTVLFEDELEQDLKNKCNVAIENNMKDSFISNFLFNKENQQQALLHIKAQGSSKSAFRDSFIPDFSLIEDSQPQAKQIQCKSHLKAAANESIMPEFSFIKNTQPKSNESEQNSTRNKSLLPDFSMVPETQSNESVIKSSQPITSRIFQPSLLSKSTASKNCSLTGMERSKTDSNRTASAQDDTALKNILMESFVRDFSEIKEPRAVPLDTSKISLVKQFKTNSSLKFLDESLKQSRNIPTMSSGSVSHISAAKDAKPKCRAPQSSVERKCSKEKQPQPHGSDVDQFFELNCETAMFGTNISMIKNSTWLPNHGPSASSNNPFQAEQIHEKSLHIKCEDISTSDLRPPVSSAQSNSCIDAQQQHPTTNDLSIELSASELAAINANSLRRQADKTIVIPESPEQNDDDNNERSIYYKQTPKTPKAQLHIWDDSDALQTDHQNHYVHAETDLNNTHLIIENMAIDANVNPFNVDLINAFLEQHYVVSYLESLPTCKLVGCVPRLMQNVKIDINGTCFSVLKLVGEGAYGAVFW